jgi:ABC-type uncharacterized transport system involved in gliding motility auxiliary subunit
MPRLVEKTELTRSQKAGILAGWLGLVALVIGGLLYYREPILNWTVKGFLIAGILLVAAWISLAGAVAGEGLRKRHWGRDLNGAAFVLAILFIFAAVNFISSRRHVQWDLTKTRKFTLAPLSQSVARKITEPVTVTAFYSNRLHAMQVRQVEDLLKQYQAQNDKLKIQVVDPLVNRKAAVDKNVKTIPTLLFETQSGKRQEISNGEEKEITGALLKLTTAEKKKIYFLQGHGELDLEGFQQESGLSALKQALTDQQHEVATLKLLGSKEGVPADAAAVIIAGPRFALQPSETKALQTYLNGGGSLMVLAGPKSPDMKELLGPWGISIGTGTVVDVLAVQSATTPAVLNYDPHDITRDLGNSFTAFPASRPVIVAQTPPTGVTVSSLLKTSDRSWAETNPEKIQYDGKDMKGPITLGAVAEKSLSPPPPPGSAETTEKESKKARVVVFGSADFATNFWMQSGQIANQFLVLNAVNWAAEEPALVNIPPKDNQPERVMLSDSQLRTLQILNFVVIPVAALAAAVFVWWKRR